MEPATRLLGPAAKSRVAACLWCHEPTSQAEVVRNHGLCHHCAHDDAEINWRLIYDRDRNIGSIPSNLRARYGL